MYFKESFDEPVVTQVERASETGAVSFVLRVDNILESSVQPGGQPGRRRCVRKRACLMGCKGSGLQGPGEQQDCPEQLLRDVVHERFAPCINSDAR
jgi:hypothetical protein